LAARYTYIAYLDNYSSTPVYCVTLLEWDGVIDLAQSAAWKNFDGCRLEQMVTVERVTTTTSKAPMAARCTTLTTLPVCLLVRVIAGDTV
jgi:hypothetical protein